MIHNFLHKWFSNFKYICFLLLLLCLWPGHSDFMALFMVFNLWIGPGFIF